VKRKAVTVTPAAIRAAARQNTKASARLEGREVPADFIRSPAVERYIAECGTRTADALALRRETDRMIPSDTVEAADGLLSFLKTEIWPLLEGPFTDHQSRTRADAR
jgi:antitoxin VapB